MKIAFFVHGYLPWDVYGVPSYVERLAHYMAKKGHKTAILCVGRPGLPRTQKISDKLMIYRSWYFNPPKILAQIKGLWSLVLYTLWCIMVAPQIVKKEEIDVLHGHTFDYGGIQCLIVSAMTRKSCVITIHGVGLAQNKAEERAQKILLHHATLIICQRNFVFEKLLSWGFQKDKVTLIEAGSVDTEKFKPRGGKPSTRKLIVTFVGRLVPFKGPELFLDAIPFILSSYRNVIFQFVGDGPLTRYLIEKSKKMKLESNVRFLGSRSEVNDVLKASDVYVASSPHENFSSLALFEAMSCGLPVVATDVGETKKLIRDKETLLLAKPDPYDIAEKISRLLRDQNLRERLGKNARLLVLEKYSLDALGKDHEIHYLKTARSRMR